MWEVYTNIQLNCYWYPPWKTGALRRSRPLLLAPDFSKLFWRANSNEGRLADGLVTENCFFVTPGLTGARVFLLFPGLEADRLQQGRPSFSCSATYCTSPTSLPQQRQRCGQSFEAHSHRQVLRQRFRHWTNAPVYSSSPSSVT